MCTFKIEDKAVSVLEYYVVTSGPDFQTKPVVPAPDRLVLVDGLKIVAAKDGKIIDDITLTDVNVRVHVQYTFCPEEKEKKS